MNNAKDHTTAADAADQSAGGPPTIGVGVSIGIGAGLGMVVGILVGDMVLGMLYGAGLGTVVGAVRETLRRRRVDGRTPPPFPRTKGNLWLVVLLHTAVNNSAGFWLPVTAGVYAAMVIVMVTLIITDRMWRVRPPERVLARADGQLEPVARS